MSIINTEDAVKQQIYSRDLREFVVPVRILKSLPIPEMNVPDVEHYEDLLRLLFNRCMYGTDGTEWNVRILRH